MVSQEPPLLVTTEASNVIAVPVVAIERTCGRGFAPPKGIVKAMGFTCRNTLLPTLTVIGTVTLLPVVRNRICPTNVPLIAPAPGRFSGAIITVIVAGVEPLADDRLSQLFASEVLTAAVQLNVPVPPFRTCRVWEVAVVDPVSNEKVNCPGMLSKY